MCEVPNSMNQVENLPDEPDWDDEPPNQEVAVDKISCETCILKDDPTCENYLCD